MNFFEGTLEQESGGLYFKGDGLRVRVHDGHVAALQAADTRNITLGVRPEDIQDTAFAVNPDPETVVEANVEVVEPMGSEIYLYLSLGSHNFIARVDSHEKAHVNQKVSLAFDMAHASFFSPEGEGPRIV